jgi:hypothetical protein
MRYPTTSPLATTSRRERNWARMISSSPRPQTAPVDLTPSTVLRRAQVKDPASVALLAVGAVISQRALLLPPKGPQSAPFVRGRRWSDYRVHGRRAWWGFVRPPCSTKSETAALRESSTLAERCGYASYGLPATVLTVRRRPSHRPGIAAALARERCYPEKQS